MSIRPVKMLSQARPAMEGAGVHLHRVFGFGDTASFDPFLMMDDFGMMTHNNIKTDFHGTCIEVSKR